MAHRLQPGDCIEKRGSTGRVIMTYEVEEVPPKGKVLLRARTGALVRVRWRYASQLPGAYSLREDLLSEDSEPIREVPARGREGWEPRKRDYSFEAFLRDKEARALRDKEADDDS